MQTPDIKQQVREFYDQVGWQQVSQGTYQNARYEDLRPVSHEYIHRCHLRVKRFLKPAGRYLLDAGSGPVQYPEYLTYSQGFSYRVCADISMVALQEARKRLGDRGLYVVADVANLPFRAGVFESTVSLHTLHHLPPQDHARAYAEIFRTLAAESPAVIVNGKDRGGGCTASGSTAYRHLYPEIRPGLAGGDPGQEDSIRDPLLAKRQRAVFTGGDPPGDRREALAAGAVLSRGAPSPLDGLPGAVPADHPSKKREQRILKNCWEQRRDS